VKFHYIKEALESSEVTILKVRTKDDAADSLTNAVDARKFAWCKGKVVTKYWSM